MAGAASPAPCSSARSPAGVAAAVVSAAAALVVGALAALGLVVPWARVVALVGGVAFIVAGCANVVEGQNVHHYLPGANWAGTFVHAGNLIWLGVVLLLADAVITGFGLRVNKPLRRREAPGRRPGSDRRSQAGTARSSASTAER